jgi:flagella basal body P-ring formation protein FlgA
MRSPFPTAIRYLCCLWLAFACLIASSQVFAARQDLNKVYASVRLFVQQQLQAASSDPQFEIGKLDPRLYLPDCKQQEAFLPGDARLEGKTRIGVRCLQPVEWSIIVPVTVKQTTRVVILNRLVNTGQTIEPADINVRNLAEGESAPPAALNTADQAIGKVAIVTLGKGLMLRADMLRQPYVILQNQTVTLMVQGEGFQVGNDAKALGNASVGQPVSVKTQSGQIVRGIARGLGVVVAAP